MPEKSMIPFGDLGKPATALIEKVSEAVGGIFKPHQIVRVAKAEAEANRIAAESQIQVAEIHRRAMHRFFEEEAKKQANIESIAAQAIPLLDKNSAPQDVEDDWITNFFDKSRIVSDKDMQQLWARILADEANAPGKFSRRTVNLLADLDKRDAELFTKLCGFVWEIGAPAPLVFDPLTEPYNQNGINIDTLVQLESLGLIRFQALAGFSRGGLPQRVVIPYFGRAVELTLPKESENSIHIGRVLFTKAGQELALSCGAKPIDGFFEFVVEKWKKESLSPVVRVATQDG